MKVAPWRDSVEEKVPIILYHFIAEVNTCMLQLSGCCSHDASMIFFLQRKRATRANSEAEADVQDTKEGENVSALCV